MKIPVIEIRQPLSTFYALKINANELLKLVDTNPYRINEENEYTGIQRIKDPLRIKEISNFLKGYESALPNSIIIAGNTNIHENIDRRWEIIYEGVNTFLSIPDNNFVNGTIIDGQHRVFGFELLSEEQRLNYDLLCSIYLDLPNPYQAYLFASINMNQKTVSKSLAYELYGYNLDDEKSESWSPEKVAVSITRQLNFNEKSIFYNHIIIAAANDEVLYKINPKKQSWNVSLATIVDGILRLISDKPKLDRDQLHQISPSKRKRDLLSDDNSPLRKYYKEENDLLVYTIINNYFTAAHKVLYDKYPIFFKTIGIQALFEILRDILLKLLKKDISIHFFENLLSPLEEVDFNDNFFSSASGLGKNKLINSALVKLDLKNQSELSKTKDYESYIRLLK